MSESLFLKDRNTFKTKHLIERVNIILSHNLIAVNNTNYTGYSPVLM